MKIPFFLILLGGVLHSSAHAAPETAPQSRPEFEPRQVVRPFKAIINAPTVNATDAKKFVQDDELVLGVEINGKSRAYPINMLTRPTREIINDTLGGKHIAATW